MATLTAAQMGDRALQALGVLAAGESSTAADSARAVETITTIYQMLRKEGLVNYESSAFPEWAQSAIAHMAALELAPTFGVTGPRLQVISGLAQKGRADIATQMSAKRHPVPIKMEYF